MAARPAAVVVSLSTNDSPIADDRAAGIEHAIDRDLAMLRDGSGAGHAALADSLQPQLCTVLGPPTH